MGVWGYFSPNFEKCIIFNKKILHHITREFGLKSWKKWGSGWKSQKKTGGSNDNISFFVGLILPPNHVIACRSEPASLMWTKIDTIKWLDRTNKPVKAFLKLFKNGTPPVWYILMNYYQGVGSTRCQWRKFEIRPPPLFKFPCSLWMAGIFIFILSLPRLGGAPQISWCACLLSFLIIFGLPIPLGHGIKFNLINFSLFGGLTRHTFMNFNKFCYFICIQAV